MIISVAVIDIRNREEWYMKKTAMALVVLMVLAAALAGCGGTQAVYGKNDTDIAVKAGGTFTIKLEENPTTGYQWSVSVSDESVVALDKDEYVPDDKSGEMVGSGGTRVLTFKALKAGTAAIDMVYEQSWEPDPGNEKIQFSVKVS